MKEKIKLILKRLQSLKKLRRKALPVLIGMAVILAPILYLTLKNPPEARAWWNDNWNYRKKVIISNSGSELTNHQVKINLDTSTPISNGKMNSDCSDIRIVNRDNSEVDPYFIGSCNTTNTNIWIKFSTVPTTDFNIYIYYGNQSATQSHASPGTQVFEFFDGFDDGSIDSTKWVYAGTVTESGGTLTLNPGKIQTKNSLGSQFISESKSRVTSTSFSTSGHISLSIMDSDQSDGYGFAPFYQESNTIWQPYFRSPGSWSAQTEFGGWSTNQWYQHTVTRNSADFTWDIDGSNKFSGTHPGAGSLASTSYLTATRNWDAYANGDGPIEFDWIATRKYTANEPTASVGSEEISKQPAGFWRFDEGYGQSIINPLTKNEQQINIIDQTFSTNSTSYAPTDNSLGIVHWDADEYTGATVYFEAVFRTAEHTGNNAFVALYKTDGTFVTSLSVPDWTNGEWYRMRTNALTLTDDTDYTVRAKINNSGNTAEIKSARLIIAQSDSTKITNTETQIEVGNNENTTSNTYNQLTDKKIYNYDSTKFSPTPTAYFEASLKGGTPPTIEQQINIVNQTYSTNSTSYVPTDNSLGLINWDANKYTGATVYFEAVFRMTSHTSNNPYVGLYTSDGTQVTTLSGEDWQDGNWLKKRSGALTLTDDTDYTVRAKTNNVNHVTQLRAARLIIIQSDSTKITDTSTQIEVGDTEKITNTSNTPLTDKKIYNYDSTKFSPAPTAYFEASLKSSQPTIEQQINIVNQTYSTNSTSYVPTDNSLGLINWDANKYTGATVYFEAVFRMTSHTSNNPYVGLYTSDGTQVTTLSGGDWKRGVWLKKRSGALTLTDDTDYTVRARTNNSDSTTELKAARLIIIQSDSTKITDTSTQIEVGGDQTSETSETYVELDNPKYYQYDQDQFSPTPEGNGDVSFAATVKIDDSSDSVYAQLYNKTDGAPVAEFSHTGNTNWTYSETTDIDSDTDWDTTNDDEYVVRIKCVDGGSDGCSANIANAKIILDQSDSTNGITDIEIVHQQINTLATDTDNAYSIQNFRNRYNPEIEASQISFAGGAINSFYEATIKTSTDSTTTAYARIATANLYNPDSGLNISGIPETEISTTSSTYQRVRGGDITSDLPNWPENTYVKNLDTQIKNSASSGETTSVSNSWLIIQVSNLPTSGPSTAYASLHTSGTSCSSQVSGSEISSSNDSWSRIRSSSISLTSGTDYMVCVRTSSTGIRIANAKIVLDQTDANGITDLEIVHQQINQDTTDTDSTYSEKVFDNRFNPGLNPTQLSFGAADLTYYFETTMKTDSGTAYARLHNDSDGSTISGSEVTTTNTSYTRTRSGDITSNMPSSDSYNTAQTLDTQLKNSATNTTTASNSWLIIQVSNLQTSGGATAYAELYNLTDSTTVSGSEITNSSESWSRVRSNAISLTNEKDYVIRFKSGVTNKEVRIANAKIILDQSDENNGIYSVETVQQMINTNTTDGDSTYSQKIYDNYYDPNNNELILGYNDATINFEATMKTSNGDGSNDAYARLYNDSDSSVISGSEITTSSTSYTRVRTTSSIESNMPTDAKVLDTQLKNEASSTTSVSNSWLIIYNNNTLIQVAHDSSNNENHGGVIEANWADTGCKTNKCLEFDGSNDYILVTDDSTLDFTSSNSFTITGWFKHPLQSSGTDVLLSKFESSGNDGGYKIYMESDGDITFGIDDDNSSFPEDSVTSTEATYDDNMWHQFTAIKNGATDIKLYIDGTLIGTDSSISATGTLENNDSLLIGIDGDGSSNPYKGYLDEIKIYPYARTTDEINTDFVQNSNITGTASSLGNGSNYNLYESLVGYWDMNESSADTCDATNDSCDSSGYDNDATWSGDVAPITGKFGNAIDLDGTGDEAQLSSTTGIPSGSDLLTISAWINADTLDTTQRNIIARGSSSTYDWYVANDPSNAGQLVFTTDGTNIGSSSTTLSTGSWYHIVVTADTNDTASLYVNGDLDATTTHNGTIPSNGDVVIGAASDAAHVWDGKIDEVRVYDKTLSANDVKDLYRLSPAPEAYYDFDENEGTSTVYDKTGNGNNLTINSGNESNWINGKFGSGFTFDGNNYLSRTDDSDFDYSTSDSFTISGWIKHAPQSSGQDVIFAKYETSGGDGGIKLLMESDGDITCGVDTDNSGFPLDSATSTAATYDDNTWHFVTCTKNGTSSLTLYIDGEQIAVDNSLTSTGTYANNDNLYFGIDGDGSSNAWVGQMDDFKFYNYARSSNEIYVDMNASHPAVGTPVGSSVLNLKFDEGYGTTAYDSSPQENNGSLSGTAWTNEGKFGKATSFNGSSDRITVSADSSLEFGTNSFSVEFWYNTSSTASDNGAVGYGDRFDSAGWSAIIGPNGSPQFVIDDSSTQLSITSSESFATGNWHHYAISIDKSSGNGTLYIDGIQVGQNTNIGSLGSIDTDDHDDIEIGRYFHQSAYNYYTGKLDELKIYGFALTENQVKTTYNQGKAIVFGATSADSSGNHSNSSSQEYCVPGDSTSCSSPVAEYKVDYGSGTTAYDTSENIYNGTLGNGTPSQVPDWIDITNAPAGARKLSGKGLYFDGSDDYVEIGTGPSSLKTVEFWAKPSSTTEHFINITSTTKYIWANAGQVTATGFTSPVIYVNGLQTDTIVANEWQHIVVTTDTGENADNLEIGRTADTNYLKGSIDSVALYDYARTRGQVAWSFNKGKPLAHWKLDECEGATVYDTSNNSNSGSVIIGSGGDNTSAGTCDSGVSTEAWNNGTTGKFNHSLDFDGSDDYINVPDDDTFDFGTGDFTMSAWIKSTQDCASDWKIYVSRYSANGSIILRCEDNGSIGNASFYVRDSDRVTDTVAGTSNITDGNWHHIVGVKEGYSSANLKIYVDGKLENTSSQTYTGTFDNNSAVNIGRLGNDSRYADALIDDVRIFNYSLTDEQIQQIHTNGTVYFN